MKKLDAEEIRNTGTKETDVCPAAGSSVVIPKRSGEADIGRWIEALKMSSVSITCSAARWCCVHEALTFTSEGHLVVTWIAAGFFGTWNASNLDAQVQNHDRLVEVNGTAVDDEHLRRLQNLDATVCMMKFTRLCPNAGQMAVIERVARRVRRELHEKRADEVVPPEPFFELVHSEATAGGSNVVTWLRELFVDVLGWDHGSEFVCLAFGKTEAAKIEGYTIHRWAKIPVHDSYETTSRRGVEYHERCLRCRSLHWMATKRTSSSTVLRC